MMPMACIIAAVSLIIGLLSPAYGQLPGDIQGGNITPLPEIPEEECIKNLNENRIIRNGTCYTDTRKMYLCVEGECKYWSAGEIRQLFLGPLMQSLQEPKGLGLTENQSNSPFTDPCSPLNLVVCETK